MSDRHIDNRFASFVNALEERLAEYYEFELRLNAANFFVNRQEVLEHFGEAATSKAEWQARASVWIEADSDQDAFIGVLIDEEIRQELFGDRSLIELNHQNLDAFCVVAEELSHFHVLTRHMQAGDALSLLELEIQAEIDKVVLAGSLLADAVGDAHLLPIARAVFDQSTVYLESSDRYEEATRLAAHMWFDLLQRDPHHRNILEKDEVAAYLQSVFFASGERKMRILANKSVA